MKDTLVASSLLPNLHILILDICSSDPQFASLLPSDDGGDRRQHDCFVPCLSRIEHHISFNGVPSEEPLAFYVYGDESRLTERR